MSGKISIVLHAHLPYIRHPEHEYFLEEDWFFEAITETYIPLIASWQKMAQDKVPFQITLSLSPTLCSMLEDSLLQERYQRYLDSRLELSEKEISRQKHPLVKKTARLYVERFSLCEKILKENGNNIINALRDLKNSGHIEVLTSTATHGFLPLMIHPEALRVQIQLAQNEYQKRFGEKSPGIWLGECAFDHRVGAELKKAGFQYFFLDKHGVEFARPAPGHGVHAPIQTPEGVYAFGRDLETAQQVWSAAQGYPGDPSYREFYRDIGYDAEYDYIKPHLHPDGVRRNVGLKYCRVTGKVDLSQKEPYDPDAAAETAKRHARHFLENRRKQIRQLKDSLKTDPHITSMYDAELFGHWWFEGPQFLENIFRLAQEEKSDIEWTTPTRIVKDGLPEAASQQPSEAALPRGMAREATVAQPEISSWGDKGYFEVWLNDSNDWAYPILHDITEEMILLAGQNSAPRANASALAVRALNQAAREVLLAQASDWTFLMSVGSHVQYAHERIYEHAGNFNSLREQILKNSIREDFVALLESEHNIFPEIDFRIFASKN